MGILKNTFAFLMNRKAPAAAGSPDRTILPNEPVKSSERGARTTPENEMKYLYRLMWVDSDLRQAILDVREMDRLDGRVKRIHGRRLQLDRVEKLKSDARGLVMEGNLPLQWVLDTDYNVISALRMPSETIIPDVDGDGRFKDVRRAYVQFDVLTGRERVAFPLWQLFLCRYDPDNFDDMGSLGRPFLDATRTTWRKLVMTEEDLVIRRRVRAPLRLLHAMEGMTKEELLDYQKRVERDQNEITTDYYSNKKGSIQPVQGDANLDHVKDVVHLLDSFFAGSPLPKGMMGFTDGLARDILADLKDDYYGEVDSLQDTLSFGYEMGFRLHLMLRGINPDNEDFCIKFGERSTETPNQAADRALKWQAMGIPTDMVWEQLGLDATYVRKRKAWEEQNYDPYPDPEEIGPAGRPSPAPGGKPGPMPKVSITPGNRPKGESATSITND